MFLSDKVILLTDGTGSFGQKFTEIALKEYNPKTIRVYYRGKVVNCISDFHGLQTWEVNG